MKKIYILLILTSLFYLHSTTEARSQSSVSDRNIKSNQTIEGLDIYPNPPNGDRLYITSDLELTKTVTIFNILGEKVLFKIVFNKELDISILNSGVYIIQIKEEENTATRKLVIR